MTLAAFLAGALGANAEMWTLREPFYFIVNFVLFSTR